MKEWFVVYEYHETNPYKYVVEKGFIYGEGTAQDTWLKFKDAGDKLISITRV